MMPAPAANGLLVAGIGGMVVSGDPGTNLVAYGLGSCVGLIAWDPRVRAGGLAHFMLPSGPADQIGPATPVKFVEGGFQRFLAELRGMGIVLARAEWKAAGGASMLQVLGGGLDIGRRNVEAVTAAMQAVGLKFAASDLGGRAGRTVQLDVGTGRLLVKSVSNVYQL